MKPPAIPPAANPDAPVGKPGRAADFRKLGISEKLRGRTLAPELLGAAESVKAAVSVFASVLLDNSRRRVIKTPDGEKAIIHREWLEHIVSQKNKLKGGELVRDPRERFAKYILPALQDPDEIWLDKSRKRFVKVFKSGKGDKPILLVLHKRADGFLLWTAHRTDHAEINKQRSGALLYSRELQMKKRQ